MKSNVSAAGKSFGSQASKPWWMSKEKQGMPSSSQTSRQVPLPAHGSQTSPRAGSSCSKILNQVSATISGPYARSPYSPARWK